MVDTIDRVVLLDAKPTLITRKMNWLDKLTDPKNKRQQLTEKPQPKQIANIPEYVFYIGLLNMYFALKQLQDSNTFTTEEIYQEIEHFRYLINNEEQFLKNGSRKVISNQHKRKPKLLTDLVRAVNQYADLSSKKIYTPDTQEIYEIIKSITTKQARIVFKEKKKEYSEADVSLVAVALTIANQNKKTTIITTDSDILNIYLKTKSDIETRIQAKSKDNIILKYYATRIKNVEIHNLTRMNLLRPKKFKEHFSNSYNNWYHGLKNNDPDAINFIYKNGLFKYR